MRVIWVSPSLPHPEGTGGCVNEFELIRALAGRHHIEVVTSEPPGPLDPNVLVDVGATFTRVPWQPRPYPTSRVSIAREMLRADPNLIVWLRRDRLDLLASAVRALSASSTPDLVQVTLGEIAPLLGMVEGPTGMYLFDSLTREIEHRMEIERVSRRRAQLALERWRTRQFERRWYRRATALASVSTVDAEWFERVVGRPVAVIENSIPERMFEPSTRTRSTNLVTFVGTLTHPPNADAIEWIASDIWPLVVERRPDAQFLVVGRGDGDGSITARIRGIVEAAGGRLDADVDDIRPYYWEAAVLVAPIRLGAGMRSKVIHGMASRTPVVVTPTAVEGLPVEAVAHARVASTAEDLAAAIVTTLDDGRAAQTRADGAADAVSRLRVSEVAERLESWWESIARSGH